MLLPQIVPKNMINILFIVIQVIILDSILSVDNAIALAAIAETLPKNQNSPIPSWLKWLGGKQRQAALKVGILGAYVGRGLMLLFVGVLLLFPILKIIAALYLLYLVGVHFIGFPPLFNFNFKGLSTFWKTVIMIEIGDLAFSLDNIAAVVSISSNIWLVILGVFISIILMRFAAQLFMKLIDWEPQLENAAFVLIFAIAIELILKTVGVHISDLTQFLISLSILAVFIAVGRLMDTVYTCINE